MKYFFNLLFIFIAASASFAQKSYNLNTKGDYRYADYDWDAKFENYKLLPEEKDEPLVFIKYLIATEFAYDPKGELSLYYTRHYTVKLNSNDAVEMFNKLSFSLYEVKNIAKLKVRTINNAGKVSELDTNNIKYIENLDNEGPH
ncbi:MAG: hypothetical protein HYZ42_12685, partial [Bacteroidetes bacterium]|nr:hypothetical protein [Bacteroidota bacterium]